MIDLQYKDDWLEARKRYCQWWAGEDFGRCALSVKARRDNTELNPPDLPDKVEDRWLDLEYLCRLNHFRMQQTYYGAEAIPVWNAGYPGWDFLAAFLGSPIDLSEDTGWVSPLGDQWPGYNHFSALKLDPANHWWRFALKIHQLAAREAKGYSIPGIQAIGATGDVLAALRSTNQLLTDVIDFPDAVRQAEIHLMNIWIDVYDQLHRITYDAADQGSSNFFHIWAPGKFYIASNDFSHMISTEMLEALFEPALQMQLDYLDHAIYHVDGVDAFRHVDWLCSIDKLDGLQILPGAGKPSPLHYMDVLKKVQAAGKKLHISIPPEEVKTALEHLSAKGLFIDTHCDSESDAKDLIRLSEQYSDFI